MRSLLPGVCLLLVACSPDDLAGFQPPPGVSETSHTVSTVFEAGVAKLRVRRTLRNESPDYASVSRTFLLPTGGVATSLRLGSNGQWLAPGTLSSTEDADARWDLLTGPGTAEPLPLAKLEWSEERSDEGVDFSLFAFAPGATVDVEYDVQLPSTYSAGEVAFSYPLEDAEAGWLPPTFTGVELQQVEGELDVRRAWTTRESIDVRWATFPIDTNRTLWRLETDVAAELGTLPQRPNVVFVVDASISEGREGVDAQLALIPPYLASVPDARVEVVLFRRHAERLFGRFLPATEFARELALIPEERFAPANGSHLDVGAELAARVLAQEGGLGRMILFTDERVRAAFPHEATAQALVQLTPRDTVVHVVRRTASGGALYESRDDAAPLSTLATVTGGVFFDISGEPSDPVLATEVMRGLVRPVRIDSFEVDAQGFGASTTEDVTTDEDENTGWQQTRPGVLQVEAEQYEGSALRLSGIDANPPSQVVVRGKIWARPFERVITLDDTLSRRLPAYAIGDSTLRGALSDDELRTVAFVAGAVSPVTSYLAVPATAAPSTIGEERLCSLGGYLLGGIGCDGIGTTSGCGLGVRMVGPDLIAMLHTMLQPAVGACEAKFGAASTARLSIEATGDEVVEVTASGADGALAACLVEAGWALTLTDDFKSDRVYDVTLGR
jgi:hypothetical protein